MSEPLFEQRGAAYEPSVHTRGPWDAYAQHGGAPAALLAREVERVEPGAGMFVARATFEFFGPVPLSPLVPAARVVRTGRRFQLVEGELRAGEKVVMSVRAARLRRGEMPLPAAATVVDDSPHPPPAAARAGPFPSDTGEEGFQRTGMEIRWLEGSHDERGPARAWFRFARPLVDEERPSPLQRTVAAADFGNGVSRVLDFGEHLFINTDLSVQLHREPSGEWVLLDSRTVIDAAGVGLASSELHDELGPLGKAMQTLFVDVR